MTKMKSMLLAGAVAGVIFVFCAGCEKTSTGIALDIVTIPADGNVEPGKALQLQVRIPERDLETRQIYYPLVWSVSNPGMGFLRDTAGDSAVYEAHRVEGVNAITVRDQVGAEGVVSVTQVSPEETTD